MNRKKLLIVAAATMALVAGLVATDAIASFGTQEAAVPECDCTIYNYPDPGDSMPGVRTNGECFADACGGPIIETN